MKYLVKFFVYITLIFLFGGLFTAGIITFFQEKINGNEYSNRLNVITSKETIKKLSIKQIDSLSAALNSGFLSVNSPNQK